MHGYPAALCERLPAARCCWLTTIHVGHSSKGRSLFNTRWVENETPFCQSVPWIYNSASVSLLLAVLSLSSPPRASQLLPCSCFETSRLPLASSLLFFCFSATHSLGRFPLSALTATNRRLQQLLDLIVASASQLWPTKVRLEEHRTPSGPRGVM